MRRRRAAGFRRVCMQCSAEFRSPTHNAKYCSECTSNREGTCDDCGRGFLYHCRAGAVPRRCKDCSASHARKAKQEYWQKNPRSRKVASPKFGQCRKCGVTVCSRGPSGRAPSLCVACKKAKIREQARAATYEIECRGCQKVFVSVGNRSRKLCDDCLGVHRKAEMMTCVTCGKTRNRWASGGNSAGVCCSKKCAGMLRSKMARERAKLRGDGLRSLLSYVKKLINDERREASREYLSKCVAVAEWMLEWDEPLRKKRMRKRHKPKGSRKHSTRCRKRGLPKSYGREMSIESIGERDGWVCQLCMWPIEDRESRKSRLSPCVDHIVPLNHPDNTRHGHTEDNVQIAHRRCNERKGCSVACETLFTCDNPREWLAIAAITQTPGVA